MIFDTNILIAHLEGDEIVANAILNWKSRELLFISSVTVAEMLALPKLNTADIGVIKTYLQNFISIPLDDPLAETAALIKRTYHLELPEV